MNEKHNIDRLFQEKFKDFEVAPPDFVWENIQGKLQEKKKSKVVPLWARLSGIAALLVLGGLLTTLYFNDAEKPAVNAPAVVIENNTTTTPSDAMKASPNMTPAQAGPSAEGTAAQSTNNTDNTSNNNTTAVAAAEGTTNNTNNGTTTTQSNINKKSGKNILPSSVNSNNAVAHEGHNTNINKKNGKKAKRNAATQQGDALAASGTVNQSGKNNDATNPASATQNQKTASANEGLAAADTKTSAKNADSNNPANQNNTAQKQNALNNAAAAEGIAGTDNTNTTQDGNPANAETNPAAKNNVIVDKNIPQTEAVAQTDADTTKTVVPENELEKLLQEKLKGEEEDKALAENKKGKERWNIRPQVAPVFYSSLSDGSPINSQFAANDKTYENDLSYGLGINYAINDRISIRSGINTVNLNYATNDIAYYASLNGITSNISESKAANIVIQNPGDATPEPFLINGQATQLMEGSMVQKTGYIEVPLEMSYALVNKKFGIDVIGGVSGLFLNENNVSVVSSTGASTEVGQAQNLNNLHFSANAGVGFRYKFWDSFQASFEPTFKYQVNAYSKDAGNFKPYFIGLYSGISFSF